MVEQMERSKTKIDHFLCPGSLTKDFTFKTLLIVRECRSPRGTLDPAVCPHCSRLRMLLSSRSSLTYSYNNLREALLEGSMHTATTQATTASTMMHTLVLKRLHKPRLTAALGINHCSSLMSDACTLCANVYL